MSTDTAIALVLVDGHHNAANIAAQRFRGLLRHVDPQRVRTIVITRDGPLAAEPAAVAETIVVPGEAFSSRVSRRYLASLIAQTLAPALPIGAAIAGDSWGLRAAAAAEAAVERERAAGRRVVVLGTFCPLDAIVAATRAAVATGAPLVLDFRDGLGFEPFGMQGPAGIAVKRLLETALCRRASTLLTVSQPLVDYLRGRFPTLPVELLPNGYDPQELAAREPALEAAAARLRQRLTGDGSFLIGHFGRVCRSDPRALAALRALVDAVGDATAETRRRLHLLFMGDLGPEDQELINALDCRVTVLRQRRKAHALAVMRACDALLLLTSDRRSVATGKLYDYLAVGGRILHLSMTDNEAARLLRESGAAHVAIDAGAGARAMHETDWQRLLELVPAPPPRLADWSKAAQGAQLQATLLAVAAEADIPLSDA